MIQTIHETLHGFHVIWHYSFIVGPTIIPLIILFDYVDLNTINNNYIINNYTYNNSDHNNNDNNTKMYCTTNVCKMKRTGYDVNDKINTKWKISNNIISINNY